MIIAAVGKNATGKDYFLDYISENYAIPMLSVGDMVREYAQKDGLTLSRESLHKTSAKYFAEQGKTFFIEQIIIRIKEMNTPSVLVSGIRPVEDVIAMQKAFGKEFMLVDIVVSDDKIRFERMKNRGSARDPMTYDKFVEYDNGEEKIFGTSETEKLADIKVFNDGTQEEFNKVIDEFCLNHLKK